MATLVESHYLGKKGYTLAKSGLNEKELNQLKADLTLKPQLPGQQFAGGVDINKPFPVYRENEKKIYIPRFFGIERFGEPLRDDLDAGENIALDFARELRDYQENIVQTYLQHVSSGKGGGILEVPCGRGKTVIALNIISKIRKKSLILVHKEFLMNQWIERIEEFLPGARIGKIQAQICDIDQKDIVIGMIQTMYNKTFDQTVYSQFGMTIIDEVHRIGSEEFSKTLLKTITPYMLGISATVERKDKLTNLLYMFIGPKIYSEQRANEDPVCVRGIQYVTQDDDFNSVEYDYRGNTKFSSMIVKLCDYGPRSDFIVRVVKDLLEEKPDGQIMILAHNKSLLKYLHDSIDAKAIASVGYYIGGMKQKDLQITETKQIVIATYAMAAEALDIKTLSTLIMATPKTDITQSVGRILRMKHENPIVVDIVDGHECFQKQWLQRKRYYKKCNYRIRCTTSENYSTMKLDWSNDDSWVRVYEPKNV